MKRNGVLAVVFVLCVMSSSMLQETFAADAADPGCYDSCNMGCVQYFNNQRLFSRCDRKCQIICSPGASCGCTHCGIHKFKGILIKKQRKPASKA